VDFDAEQSNRALGNHHLKPALRTGFFSSLRQTCRIDQPLFVSGSGNQSVAMGHVSASSSAPVAGVALPVVRMIGSSSTTPPRSPR
jgi:hypothetical protein